MKKYLYYLTVFIPLAFHSFAVAAETWVPIGVGDITVFIPYEPSAGTPTTLVYKYDALGRVTKVIEDGSVKTGYCYDDAGNRQSVIAGAGGSGDCDSAQPISPPTNLSSSSHAGGGYNISWSGVDGATRYELKLTTNNYPVVGGDTTSLSTSSGAPVWIKACNTFTCSAKAYF